MLEQEFFRATLKTVYEKTFMDWTTSLLESCQLQQQALSGKTIQVKTPDGESAVTIVENLSTCEHVHSEVHGGKLQEGRFLELIREMGGRESRATRLLAANAVVHLSPSRLTGA